MYNLFFLWYCCFFSLSFSVISLSAITLPCLIKHYCLKPNTKKPLLILSFSSFKSHKRIKSESAASLDNDTTYELVYVDNQLQVLITCRVLVSLRWKDHYVSFEIRPVSYFYWRSDMSLQRTSNIIDKK